MKVLIFTPIAGLDPEAVQSAFTQEWDGPLDILYSHDNPHGEGHADVLHNYQKAREWALAGRYDALLTLESDMVVPAGTLNRLVAVNAPVVHALYCFRGRGHVWSLLLGNTWAGQYAGLNERKEAWGQVVPALGVGFGCTLIRREALEAVPFRSGEGWHCDGHFAEDCAAAGIRVMVHCGAVCGHKGRNGVIWWPTADGSAAATTSSEQELYKYIGEGDYILGLPARDLSPEEWGRQPADLRAQGESLGTHKRLIPQAGDWIFDRRFEPCQK
jgi:hypothetical protein